jgi:hypothetical protein
MRREAGFASNNAEEVLARLHLERLETSATGSAGSTALALIRRLAGTATGSRIGSADVRDSDDLAAWIHAAATEIAEYLAGDTVIDSLEPFPNCWSKLTKCVKPRLPLPFLHRLYRLSSSSRLQSGG